MIRFRLKELMADKSFAESRRVTFEEVSSTTGINRTTLSKMANQKGYNTTTDNLDALCSYFGVSVCEVAEHISEQQVNKTSDEKS